MRVIKEPTFHQKMWGVWVTAETISKNMGSLGDSSAENRGSLEPYIRITSIMGVAPPPRYAAAVGALLMVNNFLLSSVCFIRIQHGVLHCNLEEKIMHNC